MAKIRVVNLLIAAGFILLWIALFYLQIISFPQYHQLSQANRIRILPQPASRGRILDCNGNILAADDLSYNLLLIPESRQFPQEQISKLSKILSVSEEELKQEFSKKYTLPFVPLLLSEDLPLEQAVAIGQLKYDLPRIDIQVVPKRVYTLGNVTSHILGYMGEIDVWRLEQLKEYGYKVQDLIGYSGVEEVYDYILRPIEGGMQVEVDNRGRLSRILGIKAAKKGRDIQLTVDARIQKIIHDNLKDKTGSVVVINPQDGELIALASYPDFDPLVFQKGRASLINPLLNDPDAPLFNRAISGQYPPGSVFKVIVASAGIEKKKIGSSTTFICSGELKVGNRQFSCWGLHGEENIRDAIVHSCNVFFYNLGLSLGPQLINEYALKFGLGQRTGIDLNAEATGYVPYSLWERIRRRRSWYPGDTANLSIGQGGLLVTPLQIARMMAVFANGGKLIKPVLIKSIENESNNLEPLSRNQSVNLLFSKETLEEVRKGLIGAVRDSGGTASVLSDLGVSVAGKTGSAQVGSGRAHGWFAGFFPVENPKFVICVFLEHGGSGYYACRVTRKIIEEMLKEKIL
ncbi:MAG: penicillin-binding protein 2 [Candidatus Omnitrophica bacterium]|nr:penicillin-binding protein 2 [Candidatus Omnitrophota bacterium]